MTYARPKVRDVTWPLCVQQPLLTPPFPLFPSDSSFPDLYTVVLSANLIHHGHSGNTSAARFHHRSFAHCPPDAFDYLFILLQLQMSRRRQRTSRTQTTAAAGKPAPPGPQTASREPLERESDAILFLFLNGFSV